ncbi:MAG: PAS domain-containing protein [Rhodobacteraceae bacterium]|nr:PAS domain-containing protein [Paracoccaceae bacterium]
MREFLQSGEKITPLFRQKGQMQDPVLLDLLNYWERLRGGRIAPMRSEIDPREISGALEYTFILEHTKLNQIRFRLAGNKLCDLLGMELRGIPAYALIAPESRDYFTDILTELLAEPKIIHLQLTSQPEGFGEQTAQMLLLPMRNDAGQINRILGCVSSIDARIKPPCRFTISGKKTTRIVSSQTVMHDHVSAGFAEETQPFTPRTKPTDKPVLHGLDGGSTLDRSRMRRTRQYLRLVTDD